MSHLKRGITAIVFALCGLSLSWPVLSEPDGAARMYKINKKKQERRINLKEAGRQKGCHNLRFGKKVHRFAQAGFEWCSIYAEEDCAADSLIPAMWEGRRYRRVEFDESEAQAKMYPGTDWIVQSEGERIQSWYCEAAK